jgi:hypothetical protein
VTGTAAGWTRSRPRHRNGKLRKPGRCAGRLVSVWWLCGDRRNCGRPDCRGPGALSGTYFYFPLAYGGGRVFVNDFDGTLRAFNAATGAQEWSTTTNYFSGEPVMSQGEVWVQGSGSVYGLSAKTGAIEVQTGYLDGDGAAPAADKSGVYVSTGCQTQIKLSLSGQTLWEDSNSCSGGGGASTALWRGLMYGQRRGAVDDHAARGPRWRGPVLRRPVGHRHRQQRARRADRIDGHRLRVR